MSVLALHFIITDILLEADTLSCFTVKYLLYLKSLQVLEHFYLYTLFSSGIFLSSFKEAFINLHLLAKCFEFSHM